MARNKFSANLICGVLLAIGLFASGLANAKSSVIFAIDIIRHGDRTPIKEMSNDSYLWPEGLGELTALGMHQEFTLGQKLRKLYVQQYGLLPNNYTGATLYVRSSDYNRTLMSAQAALLGLYPLGSGPLLVKQKSPALPMQYQPIPIHTIPQSDDSMLIPKQNQPEFKHLITKYVINTKAWQEKSRQYRVKLQGWSKVTGMRLQDLQQLTSLGDNLRIRMLHGVALPHGITNQDRDQIIELANWITTRIYGQYEVGAYGSRDLRLAISKYLTNAAESTDPILKYVLFSAHDSTLMAIMSALSQPLATIPPYASDLRILLLKDQSNYSIELSFNEQKIKLKDCLGVCSLTGFLQALTDGHQEIAAK